MLNMSDNNGKRAKIMCDIPYEFTGGTIKDTFEKFKEGDHDRFMENDYIGKHPEDFEENFDPFVTGSYRIFIDPNNIPDFLKKYDELARYRQPLTKAEEKSMNRAIMERIKIARKLRRLKKK